MEKKEFVTVDQLLQNPSPYLGKDISLRGVLVGKWGEYSDKWFLVSEKSQFQDTQNCIYVKPFVVGEPKEGSFKYIHPISSKRNDPYFGYQFVDSIEAQGCLAFDETTARLVFDLEFTKLIRPDYMCYMENHNKWFELIPQNDFKVSSVQEVVNNPSAYIGKTVNIEGVFIGNDSMNIFYVEPYGIPPHDIEDDEYRCQSIELNGNNFVDKLIKLQIGAIRKTMWHLDLHVVGKLEASKQVPYSLYLYDISDFFLLYGTKYGKALYQLTL